MADVIHSANQITPEWLTEILREHRVPGQGRVIAIEKDCAAPFGATVCKLRISYSDDAPQSVPERLFMKILPGGGAIQERGKREVQFYQALMESDHHLPVPSCYYAAFDDDTGTLNLLLEDLSTTHIPLEHELPPTEKHCYQLMEVLAQIHAFWWERPHAGILIETTPQTLTDEFNADVANYGAFADFLGDRLLSSHRAIYENVINRMLLLRQKRFASQKHITLSHGDAHAWNFMYPVSEDESPRLLDWEACGVNVGAMDAAYLMAVFWHPERRQWLEKPLLRHYHRHLLQQGISGYTWEDCWYDYRLSVINLLFMPVWWWVFKTPAFLWWYRLERLMMAYDDLECAELLD